MINKSYKKMLEGKSIIRELSEYATARGKEIGYENVFDYSLGNPSVPCPADYTNTVVNMYQNQNPMAIHGYSPSLGIEDVRKAVAESLAKRFGINYESKHIFMAIGAAGALAHAFRLVTEPGDEIIVFAPFFSRVYRIYWSNRGNNEGRSTKNRGFPD
ncbi:Aspartate/tyrosine/aromatic aminotransferase [Butyrivibrio fibrisolvens 16/4]|nr:Aspartate/tyrosine/aromatic aminotransferase [Butyrivibrio fibrisolvens 16/4]